MPTMLQGLTDLILLVAAAAAGVPFLLDREWAMAVVLARHGPPAQPWTGTDVYESFAAGGFRELIDRSPMRYDAAIHLGGAP
jgi:hypothetical protein